MHRLRIRPLAVLETRDVDVSNFVGTAVAIRHDRSVRRDGDGSGAALAHPQIDGGVGHLFPVGAETAEAQRHVVLTGAGVTSRSAVTAPFHVAAVQPHQTHAGSGHLEKRSEAMLRLRPIVVGRE